jgi:tetratricopeptide (TPR) repeat protein
VREALARAALAVAIVITPWLVGCGGHEARTLKMRTALDVGDAKGAVKALNDELEVASEKQLPKDIKGDNALLVLDRGSIQQGLVQFDLSKQDFEAADKAIDMLDLAHNAGDTIGEYVFSGSSAKYRAPPYEKLMINTLDMLNYLEQHDLNGARVEARRLSVMQKYYRDTLGQPQSPILGLGSLLAGFTFEKSNETDEALRYYDEALAFSGYGSLEDAVARLAPNGSFRSPRIKAMLERAREPQSADDGEVLFVIGYGRVPHKIGERMPIGLALTYFADALSPTDREAANKIALQGLVTWVNYPTLAPGQGKYAVPAVRLDDRFVQLEEAVNLDREVRAEWKKIEGKIIVSAITRMISRFAVGQGIQAAAGKDSVGGLLASLAAQATLTALDTPDTRSWETLPARVAVARVRLPAGRHRVVLDVRGWQRSQEIVVEKGGWSVVSLMALR